MIPVKVFPTAAAICLFLMLSLPVRAAEIDQYVAFVNNDVILESDIEIERAISQLFSKTGVSDSCLPDSTEILDNIIDRRLILSEAWRFKMVKITSEMIDDKSREIIHQAGGMERWNTFLKTNHMSNGEWRAKITDIMVFEAYVDQRIRAFIQIQDRAVDSYIAENLPNPGLKNASGEIDSVQDNPDVRDAIRKLLLEKAVTVKLAEKTLELRQEASIRLAETTGN